MQSKIRVVFPKNEQAVEEVARGIADGTVAWGGDPAWQDYLHAREEQAAEEALPVMHEYSSPVEERHIDFVLEEEFCCSPKFVQQFFSLCRLKLSAGAQSKLALLSLQDQKNCRAVRSVMTNAGETDVLVIYKADDPYGTSVALLIEDKIRAPFQEQQAERYRLRGEAGVTEQRWAKFITCLVAPDGYVVKADDFDVILTLPDVANLFSGDDVRSKFKRSIFDNATKLYNSSGVNVVDPVMTGFRAYYAALAKESFAEKNVRPDEPRDAWADDQWFNFRSTRLPYKSIVIHKAKLGSVELSFSDLDEDVLSRALSSVPAIHGMSVVKTGKSAAVRLDVAPIRTFTEPDKRAGVMTEACEKVSQLIQFAERARVELDKMPR